MSRKQKNAKREALQQLLGDVRKKFQLGKADRSEVLGYLEGKAGIERPIKGAPWSSTKYRLLRVLTVGKDIFGVAVPAILAPTAARVGGSTTAPNYSPKHNKKIVSTDRCREFYDSYEWRKLRLKILLRDGRACLGCGRSPPEVVLHVDHIYPLRKYWHMRLDPNNLQVLCHECNHGKSNQVGDKFDFRPESSKGKAASLPEVEMPELGSDESVDSKVTILEGWAKRLGVARSRRMSQRRRFFKG